MVGPRVSLLGRLTTLAFLIVLPVVCAARGQAPAAPLNAVRRLLAAGNYAAADQSLRPLLAAKPDSAEAHFLLGFALLHENKPAESLAQYTEGAKFSDPSADDLASVASDYVLLNDFTEADKWLRAALKRSPGEARLWYLLGRTQYNENLWADAERSFLECLRLEPHHLRAEYNLGLVYEAEQNPEKAAELYRTAIGWEPNPPNDIQPHLDLGMLLRREGKAVEALPLLTAAASGAGANNALARQELGLALESLGRTEDAIAEFKAAVALTPKVESLHFFLGRLYRKQGQSTKANLEFAEAARLAGTKTAAPVMNADQP